MLRQILSYETYFFFNGHVVWSPQNGGAPSSCVALIAVALHHPCIVKNLLLWDRILVLECVANVLPTKPHNMMRFVELLKSYTANDRSVHRNIQVRRRIPTCCAHFCVGAGFGHPCLSCSSACPRYVDAWGSYLRALTNHCCVCVCVMCHDKPSTDWQNEIMNRNWSPTCWSCNQERTLLWFILVDVLNCSQSACVYSWYCLFDVIAL